MRDHIIVYTEFYMEGVISMVENSRLTIEITAVSTQADLIKAIEETPNLLGVLFIEHQATRRTGRFYKTVLKMLDEIAYVSEKVVVASFLYRSKYTVKLIEKVQTYYITIAAHKFDKLNEEIIKLDGVVPIIVSTLGIFSTTPQKHFEINEEEKLISSRNSLIDALVYMLSDSINQDILQEHFNRHPELKKVYSLRTSDEYIEECKQIFKDSAFTVFCELLKEKSIEKQKGGSEYGI